ncbi:MAG: N-acyl-D-amino-acid deacylase family protein [Planctomycetota bacterium]
MKSKPTFIAVVVLVLSLVFASPCPADTSSVLIKGATIVDGSGHAAYDGDILIEGQRITQIAKAGGITPIDSATVVKASGLVVCPGFIDVHSHDDLSLIEHPEQMPKIMMGVTTVVAGNCGDGMAPFDGDAAAFKGLDVEGLMDFEELQFSTMAEWMSHIEEIRPGTNFGLLVPHMMIRVEVMGSAQRKPTPRELRKMQSRVRQAMADGALGFSTGLQYTPGAWADKDEIVALLKPVNEYGGIYTTHLRDEKTEVLDSVAEAISTAAEADVPLEISHLKSARPAWGKVREALALIDAANRKGQTVRADQYPYTASSTSLKAYLRWGDVKRSPESILIVTSKSHPQTAGQRLDKIAEDMGVSTEQAAEALLPAAAVHFCMDEDDVRFVMRHPSVMVITDGLLRGEKPHPRLYGTYPRVLGKYVRELKLLPLEEAVRKMTALPAKTFKLKDRGVLRVGAVADIVIFDPEKISDRATFENPKQYPVGINAVMVNGMFAVRDGQYTDQRAGKVIRRK